MIKSLIQAWLAPYETYIWAGVAVLLMLGGVYFVHHERVIGEQKIELADAKARSEEQAKVKKIQAALQAKADQAESDRNATQKSFDDYMASHPVGAVLVCRAAPDRGRGLPPAAPAHAGDADPRPGPQAGGEVPGGSEVEAVNVGPELDTIVRSFGTMAGLYIQYQQQPQVK